MFKLTRKQIRNNVAANFKTIRLEFKMTGKQMGEKLGLSQKSYSAIEEGRSCTVHNVYLMANYTQLSTDSLLTKRIKL